MATFYELHRKDGSRFLIDFASGWEIHDRGEKPAHWDNYIQARNMDCQETYDEIRDKMIKDEHRE